MNNWQTSAAWRKYKATYSRARTTRSVRELAKMDRELDATQEALVRIFSQHPDLPYELREVLSALIEGRTHALNPPRGRRLDRRREDLAEAIDGIVHQANALRGLREIGATDPWIDKEIGSSLKSLCEAVGGLAARLEQEKANDPTLAPLLAKTREAIAKAQDLLQPVDQPNAK